MYHWIPFWPDTAALNAVVVNNLYIAELCVSGLIMATVVVMMLSFSVRYRKGSDASRANLLQKTWHFEVGWTAATLIAFLVLFVWGAGIYVWRYQAPPGDEEVYVFARRSLIQPDVDPGAPHEQHEKGNQRGR